MDLYITKAYAQGQIDEQVFSLSIGPGDLPSMMTFGGYDLDKYAKSDINWHTLIPDYHWEVTISGFKFGDINIPLSMNITIVDSGTSFISMP